MLLEVRDVHKVYRRGVVANDGVTLSLAEGETLGLLGPNGAGKTTLVRQIIGLASPTSGSITIDGQDVVAHPAAAKRLCSYQPQTAVPIAGVTPTQAIEIVAQLRGAGARQARARAADLIDRLDLRAWDRKGGHTLSGGVVRLVAFCMAVAVPGRIVVLDEPTNDVDPLRRRILWEVIREIADAGSAVLLVTHNVLEAERAVDRLAVMDHAEVVAEGTPGELRGGADGVLRFEVVLEPGASDLVPPPVLASPVRTGRRLVAGVQEASLHDAIAWARGLREKGVVEEFSAGPVTLEDAYARLVGGEVEPDAALTS